MQRGNSGSTILPPSPLTPSLSTLLLPLGLCNIMLPPLVSRILHRLAHSLDLSLSSSLFSLASDSFLHSSHGNHVFSAS